MDTTIKENTKPKNKSTAAPLFLVSGVIYGALVFYTLMIVLLCCTNIIGHNEDFFDSFLDSIPTYCYNILYTISHIALFIVLSKRKAIPIYVSCSFKIISIIYLLILNIAFTKPFVPAFIVYRVIELAIWSLIIVVAISADEKRGELFRNSAIIKHPFIIIALLYSTKVVARIVFAVTGITSFSFSILEIPTIIEAIAVFFMTFEVLPNHQKEVIIKRINERRAAREAKANERKSAREAKAIENENEKRVKPHYVALPLHIILLLFANLVYQYIWVFKTTRYLNCVKNQHRRSPLINMFLCVYVPIYKIIWIHKSAKRVDKLNEARGIEGKFATLALILAILFPFLCNILMQAKINTIIRTAELKSDEPTEIGGSSSTSV